MSAGRPFQRTLTAAGLVWARCRAWVCLASLTLTALTAASCGLGLGGSNVEYGRYDQTARTESGPGLRVRWNLPLARDFTGPYVPVEHAAAAFDRVHQRMFIGSSQRNVLALADNGRVLWTYRTESGVEAEPTLDAQRDELFVATVAGHVHGLRASDGKPRFDVEIGSTVSRVGLLSEDALYLVTDGDGVFALSRKDGSTLWRYQRDPRAGLKIAGHAGLLSAGSRVITGFSDGSIVALSKSDGRAAWVVDTTLDLVDSAQAEIGFVDVDTTPVLIGETVYAASFLAGLYGLRVQDGTSVLHNAELTGVTGLAADERTVVMVSTERGIASYDLPDFQVRWARNTGLRGAPSSVQLREGTLFVTETRGALLALSLFDGQELGRIQTEHGFAAEPTLADGRGAILGNAGVMYAFEY